MIGFDKCPIVFQIFWWLDFLWGQLMIHASDSSTFMKMDMKRNNKLGIYIQINRPKVFLKNLLRVGICRINIYAQL